MNYWKRLEVQQKELYEKGDHGDKKIHYVLIFRRLFFLKTLRSYNYGFGDYKSYDIQNSGSESEL